MLRRVSAFFLILVAANRAGPEDLRCAGYALPPPPPGGAAKLISRPLSPLQQHRGQLHALVIFARFKDEALSLQTAPEYAPRLFDPEQVGSLSHFYHTMSSGQFELSGAVLPRRYASGQPASAYLSTESGKTGQYGQFVREILQKADADVDFARFDNDGPDGRPNSGDDDGIADYVFIDALSAPRGFIVGGATGVANLGLDEAYISRDQGVNGSLIRLLGSTDHGAFQQEGNFSQTVGSMAHEFGHALGLPDLYDLSYDDPEHDSAGVGRWCLMGWGAHGWNRDDGPNPFSAWCLKELGWIGQDNDRLVEVAGDTTGLEVAALFQGGSVYEIPLPASSPNSYVVTQEYLLLEQRTRSGSYYDRHLPGEGLLVWHIRPQYSADGDEYHKGVDLVCADGLYQDAGYPQGQRPDGKGGLDNLDFWAHDEGYAQAHSGNMGDATDPFDGARFTRLEKRSNPSIDAAGLIPELASGPGLRMQRRGERMRVEVEQLRWAGTIRQEVHWVGQVLVDGDVQVAPEGRLVIHPDTQVRFAGTDRLRAGRDPGHSELDIRGELIIGANAPRTNRSTPKKVIFAALYPGESWYGIVVNPAQLSRIEVPDNSYEMSGDEHGILLPGAPPDARGKVVKQVRLVDAPGPMTAGNGDGRLSPGETFQCVVELGNWSLTSYEGLIAELRWSNRLVYYPEDAQVRLLQSEPSGFYPGTQLRIELPPLTLSPEAPAGQQLEFAFALKFKNKTTPWQQEKLPFTVEGNYPAHQVEFAAPGHLIRGESVQVEPGQATLIQALVQGDIIAADLVVRSVPELASLSQIPMARQTNQRGRRVFEGTVIPPGPGLYQAVLRLRSAGGAVVFSPSTFYLWAAPSRRELPLLALVGEAYSAAERKEFREVLQEVAAERGVELYLMETAPRQAPIYQALLSHYEGTAGLVLWLGDFLDEEAQAIFRRFLEGGGRLGIFSRNFQLSLGGVGAFLEEVVHVQQVARASSRRLRSLYAEEGVQFDAEHNQMQLLPPAEPVVLDDKQQVAGMRLEEGAYRLVYMAFDLKRLQKRVRRHLFESTLAFLQDAVQEAGLEVVGREVVGGVAILPAGQSVLVRARAGSGVAARLIARSFPQLEQVAELPMQRTGQGFAASFQVPAGLGQYYLSLGLRDQAGKSLFNTAGLRALGLEAEQPVLLLLGQPYSSRDKNNLRKIFEKSAESLGLGVTTVDQAIVSEGALYQALLRHYLDQGEVVVWLGEGMDAATQAAFGDFLEGGGKLFLASSKLASSEGIGSFMREKVRAVPALVNATSRLRTAGALEGLAVEARVPHRTLDLVPPALPALWDEEGKVAGLRVDTGAYRLVFLPFDLTPFSQAQIEALVNSFLPFLHRGEERSAGLEVAGKQAAAEFSLVPPDRPVAVRAQGLRGVSRAEVLVRGLPGMTSVAEVQLTLRQGAFEGQFSLPVAGQYLLLLRLTRGGQSFFSGRSLQVAPFLFPQHRPVLAFLEERYAPADRDRLKTDLAAALGGVGLQANFADLAPAEGLLYPALLEGLEPGDLVVWVGRELDPGAQAVFRRFLERGGRLLVASTNLQRVERGPEFLQEVFHIRRVATTSRKSDFPQVLSLRHYPLTLEAPAAPGLVDSVGSIAAAYLDSGTYRAAYLSFDLKNVESAARQGVLESAFSFLGEQVPSQLQVRVKRVIAPAPVAVLGPLVPQVVVLNAGSQSSPRFRVGYQILRGEKVLISVDQEEASLPPGAEREVRLPPWVPMAPVDLRLRFGVKSAAGEWVWLPPQPLRLVETPPLFAQVSLPGEVSAGNGAGFFDADSDGDLDLYLVRLGAANQLFRNDGNGFAEQAREAGVADPGRGRGLAVGDADSDGDLDLFVVNEEADRFFRNEGDGRFAEVAAALAADSATALADEGSGRSAGFFDADSDGDLDLYLVNASGPNRLFRNEGGRFAERAASHGLADGGNGRGLGLADFDGDGDGDVFVANQSGGSHLYRNEAGVFRPVDDQLGLSFAEGEIAPAFGDWDGDGDLDLFLSNEWHANQLFRNEGGLAFQQVVLADSLGLGQKSVGTGWGDFDNDGDLDLMTNAVSSQAEGDQLYQNRGNGELVPVGGLVGLAGARMGRGLSFGDFDGDGDLDVVVAGPDSSRLYRNEGRASHWLELDLEGVSPNRCGLGARLEVKAGGRWQYRQLYAGFGYGSQAPARLHLGLGRAAQVDTLRVRWPDGAQTVQTRLQADRLLRVRQAGAGKRSTEELAQSWLGPGYPNPFNAATTIRFQLALAGEVRLELYDLAGQRVRVLVDQELPAGVHQRVWDGRDERGQQVASGVYFCQLRTAGQNFSRRLLLLK